MKMWQKIGKPVLVSDIKDDPTWPRTWKILMYVVSVWFCGLSVVLFFIDGMAGAAVAMSAAGLALLGRNHPIKAKAQGHY